MSRTGLFATLCGALFATAGCESSPPDLMELELTLYELSDRELGRTYEVASLFVHAGDVDGIDDLDALYLIHDDAELFWETTSESWFQEDSSEGAWVGEPRLAMPERADFPSGTYRVVLVDLAGESSERELTVSMTRSSPAPATVRLFGNSVQVVGGGAHELWLVGAGGLAGAISVQGGEEVDLTEIAPGARDGGDYELFVITRMAEHSMQAVTGPYSWSVVAAPSPAD